MPISQTKPRTAQPWKTAILAGMASYLDAATLVTTGVALVLYAPTLGLDPMQMGTLSGLLTLMFGAGALFGGRLGDRFGRRRVFNVTLIVFILGAAVLGSAVTVPMLFVGVIIAGLAIGADLPVSLSLIAEEAPPGKKGKMVAFSAVLWLGGILSVTLISTLVGSMGDIGARILYGHVIIVALVVLLMRTTLRESAEWESAQREEVQEEVEADANRIHADSLRLLFRRPNVAALVATGLFSATWSLTANTIGAFGTFMFVNLAGVGVQTAALVGLIGFPIGIGTGLLFMKIVDHRSRNKWFAFGALITVIAFAVPLVFGASFITLVVMSTSFGIGSAFAGEAIYKVWSQELFPTLLRSTAQGSTMAFTRVIAAIFAVITPTLIVSGTTVLFGFLTACAVAAGAIGLLWIIHLPKAVESNNIPSAETNELEAQVQLG